MSQPILEIIERTTELTIGSPDSPTVLVIDTGPRGDSAYEVAVQEGFDGTEAEWLDSLRADIGALVFGESPIGLINGSNATFLSVFDFVPELVNVRINGLLQRRAVDFNTSGTRQILLGESPETGDSILIDYLRT